MVPKYLSALGFVAGALTTLSFVPQLARTWRMRGAQGISAWWLLSFISGVTLWLIYGFLLQSLPIIVANAATLSLTLPILMMKVCYRRPESSQEYDQ